MHYIYIADPEFDEKFEYLTNELKSNEHNSVKKKFQAIFGPLLNEYHSQPNTFFIRNSDQKTFLHEAIAKENNELVMALLEAGHEVNRLDDAYRTPLYDACQRLKFEAVNILLNYNADPNLGYNENFPLVAIIENKRLINAEKLSRLTGKNFSHLTAKQATEHLEALIVNQLISHHVDINFQTGEDFLSPLHRAVALQKTLIVKQLVDNHVNFSLLTKDGMSVLHSLVEYRSKTEKQYEEEQEKMQREKEIADLVIPHSGAVFALQAEFGDTPLHTAVIGSNAEVVEALCKNDYLFPQLKLLSIQNDKGNTPIHEAIKEARRGPKVLNILLRLATEDDLAIINYERESVLQMAERFINEIAKLKQLTEDIKMKSDVLEDFFIGNFDSESGLTSANFEEFNQFKRAINELENFDYFDLTLSNKPHLKLEAINHLCNQIEEKRIITTEAVEQLSKHVENLWFDIHQKYLATGYIHALESVKAEDYSVWKRQILQLPNSFTGLENSFDHELELAIAHEEYRQSLSLRGSDAKAKLYDSIEHYKQLKEYSLLEKPYQYLASLAINNLKMNEIVNFEVGQRSLLDSADAKFADKLEAHLALAGLYKTLRMNQIELRPVTEQNLYAQESFHYSEAYKYIQGEPDAEAQIVLQRELGVSHSVKLGTYNIQQCVAVIAHDPNTNKVVLSHFDRYSGPLKFIDQILAEFPHANEYAKLDVYLTGARDRSADNKKVSDNNINQVLKQIYAYKERFNIKSTDLGDKVSPPAIIFDAKAHDGLRLQHRMPNHADVSLDSRAVLMNLQFAKGEYLYPLSKIDFNLNEFSRKKIFSPTELHQIQSKYDEYRNYYNDFSICPDTWKHNQLFQPLLATITETNGLSARQNAQFEQGLFYHLRTSDPSGLVEQRTHLGVSYLRQQSKQPSTDLIDVLYHQNQASETMQALVHDDKPRSPLLQSIRDALAILNNEKDDWDEEPHAKKICLSHRRKRSMGTCLFSWEDIDHFNLEKEKPRDSEKIIIDSNAFIDYLKKLDSNEAKRAQLLQLARHCEITGDKQSVALNLFQNNRYTTHLHKVESILSGLTESMFVWDALMSLNGDKAALAQWVDFKAVNYLLRKFSKNYERVGTVVFSGYDLYEQIQALRNDSGNTDAWIHATTDVVQLTIDLSIVGVKLFEMSSSLATMGLSTLIELEGGALLAILILGDRIYEDIERVQHENHFLHLSAWKKFTEGLRAFFNVNSAYQKQLDEITEYQHLLPKQFELFSHHPEIKYLIFPAITKTGEKTIRYRERMMQRKTQTKKIPIFGQIKHSSVYFGSKMIGFELTDMPDPPAGSEFICIPTGSDTPLPNEGAYACDNALGLTIKNSSATTAFFNLGYGKDRAVGFDKKPNIFMVNDGIKNYIGGSQDDIFLLVGQKILTAIDPEGGVGGLDGGEGSDSLMLAGFQPNIKENIEVNLAAGYLKYGNNVLLITHFERVYGGTKPLTVTTACDTQMLHIGGSTGFNSILIPKQTECDYNLKMYLCPNVIVSQQSHQGLFTYYILPTNETGRISVNLAAIPTQNNKGINTTFVFNSTLAEVSSILFSVSKQEAANSLQFKFNRHVDPIENFTFELKASHLNQTRFYFSDNAELKIGNKNLYYFQQGLNQSVIDIMRSHARIARRLNLISILTTCANEQIIIGHNGHEVMQNNPSVKTHLNGNGGEGVFVIQSGLISLHQSRLPLAEVSIYRNPEDTHIDTLDFRSLTQQIQAQTNTTAQLFLVTSNVKNMFQQDMKLFLNMVVDQNQIKVLTVRLKDVQNHWHKKYLHIILEVAPQQIVERHNHLYLKPIPIEFNKKRKIAVISANDVEAYTNLIIPKAFKSGAFYHDNKTNLLWTNSLHNNSSNVEPFTLILVNFYQENKLSTLSLHFTDKKMLLKSQMARLNTIKDYKSARNQSLVHLREESLTMMNPNHRDAVVHHDFIGEVNRISDVRVRRSLENNPFAHEMSFFRKKPLPTSHHVLSGLLNSKRNSLETPPLLGRNNQEGPNRFVHYSTSLQENFGLMIWLTSLFAPNMAKRTQMFAKKATFETISAEDWAIRNLHDGKRRYGG